MERVTSAGTGTWWRPAAGARARRGGPRPASRRRYGAADRLRRRGGAAVGDRTDPVVAGQSFGGYTAPLVADRLPVDALVFVAGMFPAPGETPDDWWATPATAPRCGNRRPATAA